MATELRQEMQRNFFKKGRWLLAGLITVIYLIAVVVEYPHVKQRVFYAGFIMFAHYLLLAGANSILKHGNRYLLMSGQVGITLIMAVLMHDSVTSFAFMEGFIAVLVVEDIALSDELPRHLISPFVWGYAGAVVALGAAQAIYSGQLQNVLYILESGLMLLFLAYYMYKPVYDNRYQALEMTQLNTELNAAYNKVAALTAVEERQRMARDLHDTLTQDLVGIGMELSIIGAYVQAGDDGKAQERLQHAQKLTAAAITESRSIIANYREINPNTAAISLRLRVLEQTELIRAKYNLETTVDINDDILLAGELLVDVVRMINEALMNVVKHGHTQAAQVGAIVMGRKLVINVENNGTPFPEPQRVRKGHYGLMGMRERAQSHGGDVTIMSTETEGTVVKIEVEMGQPK